MVSEQRLNLCASDTCTTCDTIQFLSRDNQILLCPAASCEARKPIAFQIRKAPPSAKHLVGRYFYKLGKGVELVLPTTQTAVPLKIDVPPSGFLTVAPGESDGRQTDMPHLVAPISQPPPLPENLCSADFEAAEQVRVSALPMAKLLIASQLSLY